VAALLLLYGLLNSPVEILRYVPHFLVSELSTILFTVAWLRRTLLGANQSVLINKTLEVAFALTFFLTRIVNLPLAITALFLQHRHKLDVLTKIVIIFIQAMQFFWFYKILIVAFHKKVERIVSKED